jgi:hypothetical protein
MDRWYINSSLFCNSYIPAIGDNATAISWTKALRHSLTLALDHGGNTASV